MNNQNKFLDMYKTLDGSERAYVDPIGFKTIWFNTGSRCNLSCDNCYIESNPKNDTLSYIDETDVETFLNEIKEKNYEVSLIGLTGGEPFTNPSILKVINKILEYDFDLLILTNAFKSIERHFQAIYELTEKYGDKLHIRISLDHYSKSLHEKERGPQTFERTLQNIYKLYSHKVNISLAARSLTNEKQDEVLNHYNELLNSYAIQLPYDKMVIFPEMDLNKEVPEITTACWDILRTSPNYQMCATERMVVKQKKNNKLTVMPCTLIAYDPRFEMGETLAESDKRIQLCHKFCAQFCVLGGASCSSVK